MSMTRALCTSDCISWHLIKLHMPDSSLIEGLTTALGDIERALLRIANTLALETTDNLSLMQLQLYCNKYARS